MRVLGRGYLTLLVAVLNVAALVGPAGVALIPVSVGLLGWTIAGFRAIRPPRPWTARLGLAVAAGPFAAFAGLAAVVSLGGLTTVFLLAVLAPLPICFAVPPTADRRPGLTPALVAAGLCIATDIAYIALIAAQHDPEGEATATVWASLIVALALVIVVGGVTGRREFLWASVAGLSVLGLLGIFSIGLPLLGAAALAAVAATGVGRRGART